MRVGPRLLLLTGSRCRRGPGAVPAPVRVGVPVPPPCGSGRRSGSWCRRGSGSRCRCPPHRSGDGGWNLTPPAAGAGWSRRCPALRARPPPPAPHPEAHRDRDTHPEAQRERHREQRREPVPVPAGQRRPPPAPRPGAEAMRGGGGPGDGPRRGHASMEQRAEPPELRPAGPTTHPQPKEGTLWGLLAILSLLAGLAAGNLRMPHCNETLDTAPTPQGMATASPAVEDGVEVPLAAAWSQLYGDNATTGGPGAGELAEDLLLRAERSPPGAGKGKKGMRKPSRGTRGRNCHIRNLMVKVRDLGLGFNSDEIVLFKYCSGSCHRARSNYDLTLGSLLRQQLIAPGPQERVLSHPCCRPTRYEAVSFMDVQNTWQTVEKLSAAECSCIG
ncbi:artemin [Buteo buteo]|uniref:artemin n=1 Tax=Buteo buteo TaxID=30397 RepID=UPI003EBE1EBD